MQGFGLRPRKGVKEMKKIIIASIIAASTTLLIPGTLMAAEGYGMGGCGLGALIFGAKPQAQVGVSITNGILANQSFAITSGTSNCVKPDDAAFNLRKQEVFAHVNFESLEQEMAIGKGEKLAAFASLMGCPASQLETFSSMVKKEHSRFFSNKEDPSVMLKEIRSSIQANENLSRACKI